jgi:hypothetical protein
MKTDAAFLEMNGDVSYSYAPNRTPAVPFETARWTRRLCAGSPGVVLQLAILMTCLSFASVSGEASSATCRLYPGDGILVRAENPQPSRWVQLSLWTNGKWAGARRALVSSEFPGARRLRV